MVVPPLRHLALILAKAPGIFHLQCIEKGADLSKLAGGRARESLYLWTLGAMFSQDLQRFMPKPSHVVVRR